jgi:hypothetical protein
MISLRALILDNISTWRTEDGVFGAKNTDNVIRYFKDYNKAVEFSKGNIQAPHPGGALKKIRKKPKKEKQSRIHSPNSSDPIK